MAYTRLSSLCSVSSILDSSRRRSGFDGVSALWSVDSAVCVTNVVGTGGWRENTSLNGHSHRAMHLGIVDVC